MGETQEHLRPETEEETMQQLRSKATELLLRKEWADSVQANSHFISLCQEQISKTHPHPDPDRLSKIPKSLCLALSNRAEARFHLRQFVEALRDCDEALEIESPHFKTLICKGKILLNLNRYNAALECFRSALLDSQASLNSESINGYLEKCKKLEFLSRTGAFDFSDWVTNGFRGNPPELAEFIGAVEIKKSETSGRGLFSTKNVDSGTLMVVTKAIASERVVLPLSSDEVLGKNKQLVMWKNLIDKVVESTAKCRRTNDLICNLSSGEEEDGLEVPDITLFRPEAAEESIFSNEKTDMGRILSILDVNSLVEDSISAKILGKNCGYYGVGLWLIPSFINHSCNPNARRLHIGDYMIVHASRDIKAGEEITFAYFDVFSPLRKRREMAKTWGFNCSCKRCKFEESVCGKQEMKEIEMGLDRLEAGAIVYGLEEAMRRWMVRGKEKGYLRASFWEVYSETFGSEKSMRRWGRRIPAREAVVGSIGEVVGSDERVINVLKKGLNRNGGGDVIGMVEMERAMKLGKGIYGKVIKKQAMRALLEL
ncbi:hypothetical protein U1Q18_016849 [Sarracenia purpurea var. burkii]